MDIESPTDSTSRPNDTPDELESLEVREADVEVPTTEVTRHGGTFESFRYRDFTWFWFGALVSNTGSWMQQYALAIVVYSFRRSEFDLGIVNFVSGIPVLVLALFGGMIADRFDKRHLLIGSQAILLVQAAALGFLFVAGRLSADNAVAALLWVASLGLVGGIMSALTFPAWQAMLPDLVPRESLLNGIALNSAQFQTSRLLGPLAASGLVILGATMGDIFFVNSASFLFVIAALAAIRLRPAEEPTGRGGPGSGASGAPAATASAGISGPAAKGRPTVSAVIENLMAGVGYARENRSVGMLILSTAVMTIFGMPYMMLLPAIADKSLHADKLGVSYLMAANGLGAVVGALVVAGMSHRVNRNRIIPFSLLAMGGLLVVFGLSRNFMLSIVISALAGAAVLTTNSLVNTSIQSSVPNHLRGRVMALFIMSFMGLMPVSALLFGTLGEYIGPSNAVLVGAVVLIAWAAMLALRPALLAEEGSS